MTLTMRPGGPGQLPDMIRFLLRHAAIGAAVAVVAVALLLVTDFGGLRTLVLASSGGYVAVFALTAALAITLGSVQMGFAIMLHDRDDDDRGGGHRARLSPVPVLARVRHR